ncbi:MAG: hypothetical protein WAT81_04510 [Candidatus Moraniibacteriota bacterium]
MFEQSVIDLFQRVRTFLNGYIEGTPEAKKGIKLLRGDELPTFFKRQFEFFQNQELATVVVAVVPDTLWNKSQPTESDAENGVILVSQRYFALADGEDRKEDEVWQTELGWLSHEYGHCEKYLLDKEQYAKQAELQAYPDIAVAVYPNNQNEVHAFRRQFAWLRSQGKTEEEILDVLKKEYAPEETVFFKRVMEEAKREYASFF